MLAKDFVISVWSSGARVNYNLSHKTFYLASSTELHSGFQIKVLTGDKVQIMISIPHQYFFDNLTRAWEMLCQKSCVWGTSRNNYDAYIKAIFKDFDQNEIWNHKINNPEMTENGPPKSPLEVWLSKIPANFWAHCFFTKCFQKCVS